jgi:serine/threonine protein kinase
MTLLCHQCALLTTDQLVIVSVAAARCCFPFQNMWMDSLMRRVADLNPQQVIAEHVYDGKTEEEKDIKYKSVKVVGNGSFGVVFQIELVDTGRDAAIKRVLQDKRFKVMSLMPTEPQNRELQIMKLISHPNVVDLKYYFLCPGERVLSPLLWSKS